jgi:hypothetical protein
MNDVAEAIDEVRSELAEVAGEIFPDLCDLKEKVGDEELPTSRASKIPCSYKSSRPRQVVIAGQGIVTLDHELKLPATTKTMAIKPHYEILVRANGLVSARTFLNPVPVFDSLSPFVRVEATLQI